MRWPWLKADPDEVAELEAENVLLDEYIDSDDPATSYPDLSGNDRERLAARELAEANARAQNFVKEAEPFRVSMTPLSPPPPKKREIFKPPVLDSHYFARKRQEREEAAAISYRSASMYGGSASHYGGATYVALGRYGCEAGHIVPIGRDRCINCGRHPWE